MSREARVEIGGLLAEQLDALDQQQPFICGCGPENLRIEENVVWAYDRRYGGFHDPREPHPTDREIAVRYFLSGNGEGGAYA